MAIVLVSPISTGMYRECMEKGKLKKELIWEKCHITETTTGEVISQNIRPLFEGWKYDDYLATFNSFYRNGQIPPLRFLEPMSAFEPDEFEEDENQIGELKLDGHRGTLHIGTGNNRLFSKRISKKTGWFNENSDQVPHIRDLRLPEFYGTVLDGEVKWGKNSSDLQGVMGALPETAIYNQSVDNKWAIFNCFDILYYKGINVQKMPLIKRKEYLHKIIQFIHQKYNICFITELPIYARKKEFEVLKDRKVGKLIRINSFSELFKDLVAKGEEGVIVKDLNGIYEQGKRSRAFLKLKAHSTWDCVFMGLTEPERVYTGKKIEEDKMNEWSYWESYEGDIFFTYEDAWHYGMDEVAPVTKPYAMGWCGGIRFGIWKPLSPKELTALSTAETIKLRKENRLMKINGLQHKLVEVGVAKGLSEECMEDLKDNWETYVKEHRVVEIMANEMINKKIGSLRHPRFLQWNSTKNHEKCTWDDYVRVGDK